ncbi:MAG: lysophospholipase [Myxococcota bacterium]
MNHHERTIEAADGTTLRVEGWEPKNEPRFVVVIVHGGAEHIGRYDRLAKIFGALGARCFGLDHRGQGHSGGRRGHVDAFEDYARDLRRVIETYAESLPAEQRPGEIPWFLFGHSMGGLISLTYLLDHAKAIPLAGAMISSPLIEVAVKVNPVKRWVGNVASRLAPGLSLPTGIPEEAICRDPAEVERYRKDPRRVGVVTAGWFGAMQRAAERVKADVGSIDVPMLWYVGTGDTVCSHEAGIAAFRSIPDAGDRGHSLHCFAGYYHELHNEPTELRAPVMEMLEEWVLARVEGDG